MIGKDEESLTSTLRMLGDSGLADVELERRVTKFQHSLRQLHADRAEVSRIDSLVMGVEHGRQDAGISEGTVSMRIWPQRLRELWPVLGGIFAAALAIGTLAAAFYVLPDPAVFLVGMLLGVVVGAMVCVRYLRREIAADISPRLRRIQLQLDNLEAAMNLALVTRYADMSTRASRDPRGVRE